MALITYTNGETRTDPIELTEPFELAIASGNATQAGAISDSGPSYGIEKTGDGTLNLTGDNSYTGPTLISAGTLVLASDVIDTASAFTIASGATLAFGADVATAFLGSISGGGDIDLGAGVFLELDDISSDLTFSGSIFDDDGGAGYFALCGCGGGSLTLTGHSDIGGFLEIGSDGHLTIDGGSFTSGLVGALLDGTLRIVNAGTFNTTMIQNGGALEINGAGSTVTASDLTDISDSLVISAGGLLTSEADASLGTCGCGDTPATAEITGTGSHWDITGTLFMDFDGLPGVLTVADGGKVTATVAILLSGDSQILIGTGGKGGIIVTPSIETESDILADFTDAVTLGADIGGDGGIDKQGVGTLTLTGTSTYAGGTILDGGSLAITNGSALGTGGLAMAEGTKLVLDGDFTLDIGITIEGDPTFEVAGGDNATLTGVIADGGERGILEKIGAGLLVLDAPNTYSGGTIISAGTLRATTGTGSGSSSVGTGKVTLDGGRFQAGSTDTGFANSFEINATGGTIDTNGSDVIIAGNLSEGSGTGGALTKAGLGMLTIKGSSTYSGDTIIAAGELFAQSNTALSQFSAYTVRTGASLRIETDTNSTIGSLAGGGAVAIGDGSRLTAGVNGKSTTFSGGFSGDGDFTKTGNGTLILSGTSTLVGETRITAGTLRVDGATVSATNVGDGATLAGRGTTGAVKVASGGTLAPGASPGNITTGDLTFAAGATFDVEIGGTAPGTGYDRATVHGAVALGGAALDLSLTGGFAPVFGNTYTIILNDGSDAVSGTFAGLAEGAIFLVNGRSMTITYHGGDGNDVVIARTPPPTTITGTDGNNLIDATHTVAGQPLPTEEEDLIFGLGGHDTIDALGGADEVAGGGGRDTIHGGDGADAITGDGGSDTIGGGADDDRVNGGRGRDTVSGDDGNDVVVGARGGDILKGGDGDDWLNGGRGRNTLVGGDGDDTFVFRTRTSINEVKDFAEGDTIALARSAFHGIGPRGVLEAKYFHVGEEAQTRKQHVLYDEDSGWLLYARKGSGTANPVAFAKIGKHLDDFDHHDILVI